MNKKYTLFGRQIILPESPRIEDTIFYLNGVYEGIKEYSSDDIEIWKTMSLFIVYTRHYVRKIGAVIDYDAIVLGNIFSLRGTANEILNYIKAGEIVEDFYEEFKKPGSEEETVLPQFLLSLADHYEKGLINYNVEKACDPAECPSNNEKMFEYLDNALDAMEYWAQLGFDDTMTDYPWLNEGAKKKREKYTEPASEVLERLLDTLRTEPTRLESSQKFELRELRIARYHYLRSILAKNSNSLVID